MRRLVTQLSEADLARLLALRGDEDIVDLGSGTGFYTERIAALTTGVVYAVEIDPGMNDHYLARGLPANVRLVPGDINDLPLAPASVDVACSIATLHETGGGVGLPKLRDILRAGGRLVVVDWRKDAESWDHGPPADLRLTREEAVRKLAPFFRISLSEDLGKYMFAVVGVADPAGSP